MTNKKPIYTVEQLYEESIHVPIEFYTSKDAAKARVKELNDARNGLVFYLGEEELIEEIPGLG